MKQLRSNNFSGMGSERWRDGEREEDGDEENRDVELEDEWTAQEEE